MKASRFNDQLSCASSLTDQELCAHVAGELDSWSEDRPVVFTTVPRGIPDWINSERRLSHLESFVMGKAGVHVYRGELAKIAGDFNPHPTARQRCEAVLSTILRAKSDVVTTS